MKIPKWSCTTCGMSSGRKFSVQRHVQNNSIHNGEGKVIPFVEYTIGRRDGKYESSGAPKRRASESQFLDDIYKKAAREVENLIIKDIASRVFADLSADQTVFKNLKSLIEIYLHKNNYVRFLKESMS